ncbi:MAG: hypothetical protein OXC11_12700 [Rhodospirillales bacterium]|nr:hypothetical protein [Rhodospirillales bacterium]
MARSRSRRSDRGRRSGAERLQKLLFVACVVFVIAVMVGFVALRTDPIERDAETNCPLVGPTGVAAIYLDTTDQVGPVSRADILGRLDAVVQETEPDEMVVAYRTAPLRETGAPVTPLLIRCHPGDPETASKLTQNPRLIGKRLAEEFRKPLDEVFRETLEVSAAETSPLMENLQAISVMLLSRRQYEDLPKRLVVVSDLIQNSVNLALYDGVPDYMAFARTVPARALASDLDEVQVEVLLVQRERHENLGGSMELIEFWRRWFEDQGGTLDRITKISGLNPS